ncbi:MAG: DUF4124 domain-containing protein [Pseudomonadota bacterium]
MSICARGVVLTACAVLAGASAWAQITPGVYTCVDAKGRKLTADRPIPECTDREQKILNPSGTVKEKLGPTLTAKERAEVEAKEKRDIEDRTRAIDEKRRDRALLTRYPNRAIHDQERAQALVQIGVVIQAAKTRLEELVKQRVAIDVEMEFYKKDPAKAPAYLRRQQDENIQSQAVQSRFIGDQDGEIRRVNERFDDELVRLRQLWALNAPTQGR